MISATSAAHHTAADGTFTISSLTPAGSFTVAGNVVTCNFPVLAAGAGASIVVNFTLNSAVDVNGTATVTSATPDPNLGNNSATGKVSVFGEADLRLVKTDSPDPVVAGTVLTYTLAESNAGPSRRRTWCCRTYCRLRSSC